MNQKEKNHNNGCQYIKEQFADYLTGELAQEDIEMIQQHISTCPGCCGELEELTSIWARLGVLPEEQPGPNLRKNFYTMLDSYQEGLNRKNIFQRLWEAFQFKPGQPFRPAMQMAFSLVLLIVGFFAGHYFFSPSLSQHQQAAKSREVTQLQQQVQEMRQELVLAMLDQDSPSQRLKAISWSSTVKNPAPPTLEALLHTLNNDPNDNVRVSAAEALYLFISNPIVKQGILDSLPRQSSPMVQVALMDLIVALREEKAIQSLKLLLQQDKLNPVVEKRAQSLINFL